MKLFAHDDDPEMKAIKCAVAGASLVILSFFPSLILALIMDSGWPFIVPGVFFAFGGMSVGIAGLFSLK